jgi:hypothetical protein
MVHMPSGSRQPHLKTIVAFSRHEDLERRQYIEGRPIKLIEKLQEIGWLNFREPRQHNKAKENSRYNTCIDGYKATVGDHLPNLPQLASHLCFGILMRVILVLKQEPHFFLALTFIGLL